MKAGDESFPRAIRRPWNSSGGCASAPEGCRRRNRASHAADRQRRSAPRGRRRRGVRFARAGRLQPSSRLYYDECSVVRPERGNNSVVECDLAKVEVAGSNPVSAPLPHTAHDHATLSPARSTTGLEPPHNRSITPRGRRRQAVRQRSAKPPSPVQFRAAPPAFTERFHGFRLPSLWGEGPPMCPFLCPCQPFESSSGM